MPISEADVQAFFFEAMCEGWVAGNKGVPAGGSSCTTVIVFSSGDFLLEDRFCTGLNDRKSAGTTIISHRTVPVWAMQYHGQYERDEIPFLKRVLRKAYEEKRFYGGRGPEYVADESGLSYRNEIAWNNFGDFNGIETISNDNTLLVVGWHRYSGMSLL